MPREQGSGSGETGEGRDASRPSDWQRIETEQSYRDAIGRKWDETHDPSPEFEKSAQPLPAEYGSHRPKHLELSPEQVTEIEEFTGRPIDEVLATRDKDPRAGHNRDEQGHILDAYGNPADTADPSDTSESASERPELPQDLTEPVGQLATDLRAGKVTRDDAADQLEEFRDRLEPTASEATTEVVREEDGYRYEKGTPAEGPGEVEPEDLSKLTELRRIAWRRGDDIDEALDKGIDHAFEVVESIKPTASEQRQPTDIPHYEQPRPGMDAGDAATTAMVVALLTVEAIRLSAHRMSMREREKPA